MTPIILDTRALLYEYAEFAPLFAFYELGLKDLVREAVITRSFNSPYTTQYHPGHRYTRGLAAKVMMDFEFAIDHHHQLYGEDSGVGLYDFQFALDNIRTIGGVAQEIEKEVDALLFQHLRTRLFEIAQEGFGNTMLPRWIGPDLAIFIRMLSQKELRVWVPPLDTL